MSTSKKFRFGVCIDDAWTYAGLRPPKSIIIPHLLQVTLPQGPFSVDFGGKRSAQELKLKESHPDLSTVALFDLPDAERREVTRLLSKNLARRLKDNRVNFVRCWFQWNLFQPRIAAGRAQSFRFPLDDFVKVLHDSSINIIGVLGNGYYRFLPMGLDIDKPEVYLARLAESSREIVRHYRGKISMWQLENEPNWWVEHFASDWRRGGIWLTKNLQDLILSELCAIVREEDRGSQTMINLESDNNPSAFAKSYSKYSDVIGLDFYPNYASASPITVSELSRKVDAVRPEGKPIMITETGYPSGPSLFGYSPDKQAEYVNSICEKAYSIDAVTSLGMWRLSDPYWLSFPFQENSFGLIDRRGRPKPAWNEYLRQAKEKS